MDQGESADREYRHRGVVHHGISSRAARGGLAGDAGNVARLCDPAVRFLPAESSNDLANEAVKRYAGRCSLPQPSSMSELRSAVARARSSFYSRSSNTTLPATIVRTT